MLIPPSFLDELRDKVPLSTLIGRKVKLTRRGHEYTGLCPFHHEKTASFTINDEKGFYHCFGCGAHGDVVRYLTDAEKMPFMEAVEHLAGLAGLKMPEQTKEQRQFEDQRTNLTAIMEEACRFFQTQLFGLSGKKAKEYLIKRGITGEVAKQFRLGYAPNGSALTQHLQSKGFDIRECKKLGLVVQKEGANRQHDYFYDRVMFPILDRRKRVIGFGGRIMGQGEPKYLNSPETFLFHKGEQLYALPQAIETMRKKNEALLVEGYMDVIALHSAGFQNAVAPLGTALTENQIKILWQSCDEPLICFDGDGAGQKASLRALYRALPILTPGKSLRFVMLPNPYDPDDMIRKKSPDAFIQVVKESRGFADMLWDDLVHAQPLDTPERMALFEKKIQETLNKIQNESVRAYYQKDFKDRLWKLTHSKKSQKKSRAIKVAPIHVPIAGVQDARMILAYLISYPEVAESFMEEVIGLTLPDQMMADLVQRTADILLEENNLTAERLRDLIGADSLSFLSAEFEMIQKSNRDSQEVSQLLTRVIRAYKQQALQAEILQKTEQYFQSPTPEVWENIKELKKEIEKLKENE